MKTTLRVVMLNTFDTCMALQHENECKPYKRRLVSIELTPEQAAQLQPRHTGTSTSNGVTTEWIEELGDMWLEQAP